jgi:hypothetical protein
LSLPQIALAKCALSDRNAQQEASGSVRAERVAWLHNLSADVLIANVAAPVRFQQPEALMPTARS